MKKFLSLLLLLCFLVSVSAQQTELKNYPAGKMAGDVKLVYSYGEYSGGVSSAVFTVDVPATNYYYFSTLVNMGRAHQFPIYIDNVLVNNLSASADGWQYSMVNSASVKLGTGKHIIKIAGTNNMVPMVDEIFLTINPPAGERQGAPTVVQKFLDKMEQLQNQPVLKASANSESISPSKVLPNPAGEYSHAIDTAFVYSHFSWIYLTPGTYVFTTSGSTVSRSLAVFNPSNFIQSSSNVNSGPGGESSVTMFVSSSAFYGILLRPTSSGASGTTNILQNGSVIVSNAVVAGKYYSMPALRGGDINFFTSRITGDTRIFTSRFPASSIRGYNDDYNGSGGNWPWGLASRIKKNFNGNDSVQYTFVCAYSPASTGVCDIYMGCGNSNLHQSEPNNFPNLTDDDAIRSAPASGSYNCISWSGGITSSWTWPPSSLSTYNCNSNNYLQCFDNFYSNNPVRYPGAWNYTRTGATVNNSVVDLWKTASAYTHASVFKPGNNHPHGYDWESKPGGTNRTFHPRNALEQPNWYGAVSNYYRPTGTFAKTAGVENAITSDADAIRMGLAVHQKAALSQMADGKLTGLLSRIPPGIINAFEVLYKRWNNTKPANSSLSDPWQYCQNREYKTLENFANANHYPVMLLIFDKFVRSEDHLCGNLLLSLTLERYGQLLDDVKAEYLRNPYDEEGQYIIPDDHRNGVLYIEKILRTLEEQTTPEPVTDAVTVSVSPNPVSDRFTVQVNTIEAAKVSVMVTSAQTGMKKVLQPETMLAAGTHRFEGFVKDFAGSNGNMLAVQVTVNGVLKTMKVMVMK